MSATELDFELYVYGPAFGLPSLDPECLAAILYFQQTAAFLPPSQTADETQPRRNWRWKLIACSTPHSDNPFRRLPALRVVDRAIEETKETASQEEYPIWVAGYEHIVSYLEDASYGEIDLDRDLSAIQRADSEALIAFIRSRGAPLLDLSLYVSSQNYSTCTRAALGEILSWPESWTVPHQLRELARKRSEHLGLSALDVDGAKQQQEKEEDEGLSAHIPKSLRKPKQTVSGLLGKTAQHTQFRVDAVTDDFLEPLQGFLGQKDSLVGDEFHMVDCLAVAYLTLMGQPQLPQGWLGVALRTKYAQLGTWATKRAGAAFGTPLPVDAAISGHSTGSSLPWAASSVRNVAQTGLVVLETLVHAIPGLRIGLEQKETTVPSRRAQPSSRERQVAYTRLRTKQQLYSQVVTTILATSSVVAWLAYSGLLALPSRRSPPSRRHFGDAGLLLGLR